VPEEIAPSRRAATEDSGVCVCHPWATSEMTDAKSDPGVGEPVLENLFKIWK